jgi:hypothetical protein
MRRCVPIGLFAVLAALPFATGAPLPDKAKGPKVYALIYVGIGKNDANIGQRVKDALTEIRESVAFAYSSGNSGRGGRLPPILKEANKSQRWTEYALRVAPVDRTGVVRVWLTDGTPEEQVAIVNCIVRAYLEKKENKIHRVFRGFKRIENMLAQGILLPQKVEINLQIATKERDEALAALPLPLEWAALPKKFPRRILP